MLPSPKDSDGDMATSSSSANGAQLEEVPTLKVSVTDPVKQGDGVQAYISYRVNTNTNLPGYKWASFYVIRRYSDFEWLRERLMEKNRGIIVPPLPEKNVVEKFRFSAEFIESRRRSLERFVNRVASHPHLQSSPELKLFLESSEDVWAMETRSWREPKVLGKKSSDYFQLFRDVQASLSQVVLGREKVEEDIDEENERLRGYLDELERVFSDSHQEAVRLIKRKKELANATVAFGVSMVMLGEAEEGPLGASLSEVGKRADYFAAKTIQEAEYLAERFEEPLMHCSRLVHAVKEVSADRVLALRNLHQLQSELAGKEAKLERLRNHQTPTRPEKIEDMEADIRQLKEKSKDAGEELKLIKEKMQAELDRFQKEKSRDMRELFQEFAKVQVEFSGDFAASWKHLAPVVAAGSPKALG